MQFAKLFGDNEDNTSPAVDTKTEPSVEPPETERPEEKPEPKPEQEPQLVVIAPDGLNIRQVPDPNGEKLGTLRPGSLIDEEGTRQTDGEGNQWVKMTGFNEEGTLRTGWVLADGGRASVRGPEQSRPFQS